MTAECHVLVHGTSTLELSSEIVQWDNHAVVQKMDGKVEDLGKEHRLRSVTRVWRGGLWRDPAVQVNDDEFDEYQDQLQAVYDNHPELAQDESGNLAIREVAIMLLSALGQAGFNDTAAAIRSRLRVTHMYILIL